MEVDKYEVLEKIGHGSFGVIRKVRRKSDGYVLCRKEINYLQMSPKEREQLQSELSVLKNLRHPNIVAYYEREHLKASQDLHIYMEYCEEGDLGKRIKDMKRNNQMAEEDFVWSVFAQIVTGLYRCHYGEDAPEVGKNAIGLGSDAKPIKSKPSHAMILHRDLKPENIFLGSDASVKLGDFGLSKIMQAHDFASTYVGTPFYMSPEICAAEQYSLHSDIWAFGCIMYELCAKEPPFNAKTHLDLIQKIRVGRVKPLPSVYSQQLQDAIAHCLKVNPQSRPDTVQLLNLPMVKLKRKELEVVRLGRQLKAKEELAARTLKEAERKMAALEEDKNAARVEVDNSLRREWEVKARLEIDRQIQQGMERLYKDFEVEVSRRVREELVKHEVPAQVENQYRPVSFSTEENQAINQVVSYHQSQSTTGETDDFPSSTDLSELSLESPAIEKTRDPKKTSRTPFTRAQTMFAGSPADINMADPSPAPIASLGLSPRRQERIPSGLSRNIFAHAVVTSPGEESHSLDDINDEVDDSEDDLDGLPALPSPTRLKAVTGDPFKEPLARRPLLTRQRTAPQKAAFIQPTSLFNKPSLQSSKENHPPARPATTTPNRPRTSKLPSAASVAVESGSPQRKPPAPPMSPSRKATNLGLTSAATTGRPPSRGLSKKRSNDASGDVDMRHAAMLNSHIQGRTLVELAQARGAVAGQSLEALDGSGGSGKGEAAVTVWDPERDEMPSPFLKRGVSTTMAGTAGGPGFRHLR